MSFIDKIKKQFTTTVPNDYELEFDICMKCGRRMPDKKYSTLKQHQKIAHMQTRKEKFNEFAYKHMMLVVFGAMFLAVLLVVPLLSYFEPFLDRLNYYINTEIEHDKAIEPNALEICGDRVFKLEQDIHEQHEFGMNHVDEMNDLIKNCNLRLLSYQYGDNIIDNEGYDPNKKLD